MNLFFVLFFVGLPPNVEYRYEKFENLNPDLFQDKEKDNKSDKPSSTPVWATPVSAVLLRRKHEIKSAQKEAQKYVRNPLHWAKYLINATYSLWFIHMPAFMVSNKAIDDVRALKLAILILQVRKLNLNNYFRLHVCLSFRGLVSLLFVTLHKLRKKSTIIYLINVLF